MIFRIIVAVVGFSLMAYSGVLSEVPGQKMDVSYPIAFVGVGVLSMALFNTKKAIEYIRLMCESPEEYRTRIVIKIPK
jgi:hypothetical protein